MKKEDVDKMSVQEACDYAIKKLVKQGGRCIEPTTGLCLYGDGKGNHCGIGYLLDEDNEKLMGFSGNVISLSGWLGGIVPQIIHDNVKFFSHFQTLHDTKLGCNRKYFLAYLSKTINTDHIPEYQQWVEMGE